MTIPRPSRFVAFAILLLSLGSLASLAAPTARPIYEGQIGSQQLGWTVQADGSYLPELPGTQPLAETGKPIIAHQALRLLVPADSPIVGVEVVPVATRRVSLPGPLAIGDVIRTDSDEAVVVDRLAVGESSYPMVWGEYGGSHVWRGYRWISIELYPLRTLRGGDGVWNEVEVLESYTVRLLTESGAAIPEVAERARLVPGERRHCESVLRGLVANPEALGGYARQDGEAVAEPAGGFQPSRTPSLSGSSVRYLIITNTEMLSEFELLAAHKTAQGLSAVVKTIDWIESNYRHGADIQETIRMFIRESYERWGIAYVLLGGDSDVIPARYARSTYHPPGSFTDVPSDLYFASLDGNWNEDGDALFGEPYTHYLNPGDECDFAAEVILGRAPVSNTADAATFVDKVIGYMETPAGTQYVNRNLFLAEVIFPSAYSPGDYIVLDGASFAEAIIDSGVAPCTSMEAVRMYESSPLWPGSAPLSRSAVVDSLQTGHFGIVNQIGHGFYFNMSVGEGNFMAGDAAALTNGDNTFLIYALNCASGAFDVACLLERFIQNPDGGAVAAIGSTRSAFPNTSDKYQQEFFKQVYCGAEQQVGSLIGLSMLPFIGLTYYNTVDRWTVINYTLLGDPSLAIWTASPEPIAVSVSDISCGTQIVQVEVTAGGQPVADALVCLDKPGEDYVHGTTNASGELNLVFVPTSPGTAVMTVSGGNIEMVRLDRPVALDGSAYITVDQLQVVDDGSAGSSGNGNGLMEAGETVALWLTARDSGGGGATGCTANLSTATGGISVTDGVAGIGTVPPGGTKLADDRLLVVLDPSVADGTSVRFFVVVIDGSARNYESYWSVTAFAPEPEISELVWSDATYGNGDGVIANGERITVEATLKNFGAGLADQVTARLRTSYPGVTLYDTVITYADIGMLESSNGSGRFSFAEADVQVDSWCWIHFEDNHGRAWRHDFHLRPPDAPLEPVTNSSLGPDVIAVSWEPGSEDDLRGYHVYRSLSGGGPFVRANVDLVDGTSYYRDSGLESLTRYFYRITAVDSSLVEGLPSTTVAQSTAPPEQTGFPLPFELETNGACAIGDVDGNGIRDIVVGSNEIYVLTAFGDELFDGDGDAQTHGPITSLDSDFEPGGLALANLDGVPGHEIIVGERTWQGIGVQNAVHVFRWDGTELPGWPQMLRTAGNGWIWSTPAVGDVDGDGEPEIVVNSLDGRTWVWHVDGSELVDGDNDPATNGVFLEREGWAQEWGFCSPALFDLDGDGAREIIFGTKYGWLQTNYMHAYRYDRTEAAGWPYDTNVGGSIVCSPTVADLDGNGVWEVLFISQNNWVHAVQQDGTSYPAFPVAMTSNNLDMIPSIAVGDCDGDGELEIVAIGTINADEAQIYVFDTDVSGGTSGDTLPGWPQEVPGNSGASPVVGDINGDGAVEILHGIGGGSTESPNNLYVFHSDGEVMDGFPITLNGPLFASPSICDLDRDGDVEIVEASWDKLVHVWDLPFAYVSENLPWRTFRGHNWRDGVHRPADVVAVPDAAIPSALTLDVPYPNPFNPSTTLRLYLPGAGDLTQHLEVGIYDLQGRMLRRLHAGPALPGWHAWIWDGRDTAGRSLASGLYFLRAQTPHQSIVRKMSLIK